MMALEVTPATVAILLVVIALAVLAIRRLRNRGICDCKDCTHEEGCAGCSAADKMAAAMEQAANRR